MQKILILTLLLPLLRFNNDKWINSLKYKFNKICKYKSNNIKLTY
jgi:hypothetical protein